LIDRETVEHVAHLARLKVTDEEISRFTGQLSQILEHMEKMKALDVNHVPPTFHVLEEMVNVMREDTRREPLSQEDALNMAPDPAPPYFRVPKVIELGVDR